MPIADILSAIYCGTENRNTTQREIKMEDVLELKDSSKKKFDGWHKNAKRNGSHEVNLMACTELLYRCCRTAVTGEGPKGRGMWRLNIVRDRTYTHTHTCTHTKELVEYYGNETRRELRSSLGTN